jgi:hypothetical protein
MIKQIFFVLLLAVFSLATYAQKNQQGGYALVRVFDANKFVASGAYYVGSKIFITYEDGKQEIVELGAFSEKTEPDNLKKITAVLNEMKKKGYLLMSATTTGDQGSIISDYVYLKQF